MSIETIQLEIKNRKRFEFGKNWKRFSNQIDNNRINQAEKSIKEMLVIKNLEGKNFLDVGSGSGLFSLAARNMGARVTSFDYDNLSVWCTNELKKKFYKEDDKWQIMQGSILDKNFLSTLDKYDYVYSWGVLHHTGDMWQALANVEMLVNKNGYLFISLYNYQQFLSYYWTIVKKIYNKFPPSRPFWIALHGIYPTLPSIFLRYIQNRKQNRGMSTWYDLIDWLGGYPFEVSTPKEIFDFYKEKGFSLSQLKTVGGKSGCNEYVFCKDKI